MVLYKRKMEALGLYPRIYDYEYNYNDLLYDSYDNLIVPTANERKLPRVYIKRKKSSGRKSKAQSNTPNKYDREAMRSPNALINAKRISDTRNSKREKLNIVSTTTAPTPKSTYKTSPVLAYYYTLRPMLYETTTSSTIQSSSSVTAATTTTVAVELLGTMAPAHGNDDSIVTEGGSMSVTSTIDPFERGSSTAEEDALSSEVTTELNATEHSNIFDAVASAQTADDDLRHIDASNIENVTNGIVNVVIESFGANIEANDRSSENSHVSSADVTTIVSETVSTDRAATSETTTASEVETIRATSKVYPLPVATTVFNEVQTTSTPASAIDIEKRLSEDSFIPAMNQETAPPNRINNIDEKSIVDRPEALNLKPTRKFAQHQRSDIPIEYDYDTTDYVDNYDLFQIPRTRTIANDQSDNYGT